MAEPNALVVTSDFANVPVVLAYVRDVCERAGLDEDTVFACELATDEACANIIEHAYAGRSDGQIRVVCKVKGGQFVVRLHDHGQPFDPDQVIAPKLSADLAHREIGGLGLHFMYSMMDEVHFEFDQETGNTITMTKWLDGEKEP